MRTRNEKGFTLVEILIVVVILGILAAIVIPQFSQAGDEARANSLAGNLQTMRSQLALYNVQEGGYPGTGAAFETAMVRDYLQSVPVNPFTGGNTVGGATDDWFYNATEGTIYAGTPTGTVYPDCVSDNCLPPND